MAVRVPPAAAGGWLVCCGGDRLQLVRRAEEAAPVLGHVEDPSGDGGFDVLVTDEDRRGADLGGLC